MALLVPFNNFVSDMGNGVNTPGTHTLKLALTNTLPLVTQSLIGQITQIPAGPGGYAAGGYSLTVNGNTQVGGVWTLSVANLTVIAVVTNLTPWRWAVIYDSATGSLIGFTDYGSVVLLEVSELVNFTFDPINGLIQGVATSG